MMIAFLLTFFVPARVGGVDLSLKTRSWSGSSLVPARVGGVDLSLF